jgi:hypothetical protein
VSISVLTPILVRNRRDANGVAPDCACGSRGACWLPTFAMVSADVSLAVSRFEFTRMREGSANAGCACEARASGSSSRRNGSCGHMAFHLLHSRNRHHQRYCSELPGSVQQIFQRLHEEDTAAASRSWTTTSQSVPHLCCLATKVLQWEAIASQPLPERCIVGTA